MNIERRSDPSWFDAKVKGKSDPSRSRGDSPGGANTQCTSGQAGCEYNGSERERECAELREQLARTTAQLEQYRNYYEQLPGFYFSLTSEAILEQVSAFAARQLGYSRDRLQGQPFATLLDGPQEVRAFRQWWTGADWQHRTDTEQIHAREVTLQRADGSPLFLRLSIRTVPALPPGDGRGSRTFPHPPNEPERVLLVGEDIGDLKQALKHLEQQRQFGTQLLEATDVLVRNFVSTVLDTANSLVVVLDREARIMSCNLACEKTTGYRFEQMSNRRVAELFLIPEEVEAFQTVLAQLSSGTGPNHHENRWLTRDGELRTIAWSNTAIFEEDSDRVKYIICTGIDITERRQAEQALRQSEERLRTQYKHIPIPTLTWQCVGNEFFLIDYNDAALAMTGGCVARLLGKSARCMYADCRELVEELSCCFRERRTIKSERFYRFCATAEPKHFAIVYVFVAPDMVMVHTEDITERKQLMGALQRQARRERLVGVIQGRIRQSLDLDRILATTAKEVRRFLQVQRVAIYRVSPPLTEGGSRDLGFVVESRTSGVPSLRDQSLDWRWFDPERECAGDGLPVRAIADLETADLPSAAIARLQALGIRAHLQVPIWIRERSGVAPESDRPLEGGDRLELWGWLWVDRCSAPGPWEAPDIDFVEQIAGELAIAIQQALLYRQLQLANQELEHLASLDALTGLANRRHFDAYLNREWQRLAAAGVPLSLILCDIDYFKAYNDTYGHLAGDRTLREVADALRSTLREGELGARYGGEEFALILPHTGAEDAMRVAQTVRSRIHTLAIAHKASSLGQIVTLSLGVATRVPSANLSPASLIAAADDALYSAKALGRDRAIFHNSIGPPPRHSP
ncbi:diguanylate cyclase [Oxynema sp. CENA135]|uniref:diguanylate cyclase domain-containing protein n=1 Tax=Oxynema sp. CENA135 TaxID=984206 RepID=UPI00190BD282|nr:diguanylate cyclase [Oxynema sp. CENA135]MBK4731797.1 diguanylate cyclase [Oxynema sp. CENA135]